MKLLLDTCVWGGAKDELQAAGQNDVLWTGDLAQDPGDEDVLAQAHQDRRLLITLDKDFGELAIRPSLPHWASCGSSTSARGSKARFACRYSRSMGTNWPGERLSR